MVEDGYPPIATLAERVVLGVSCAVALLCLLLEWYVAAGVAFLTGVAAVIAQGRREKQACRAAIQDLKYALPTMTTSERQIALERFRTRFPDIFSKREVNRYFAQLEPERDDR